MSKSNAILLIPVIPMPILEKGYCNVNVINLCASVQMSSLLFELAHAYVTEDLCITQEPCTKPNVLEVCLASKNTWKELFRSLFQQCAPHPDT